MQRMKSIKISSEYYADSFPTANNPQIVLYTTKHNKYCICQVSTKAIISHYNGTQIAAIKLSKRL